jgi:hypothetical protein
MTEPLRFSTVRVGVVAVVMDDQVWEADVRVLRDPAGRYRLFNGALSPPLASIEDAVARAEEPEPGRSGVPRKVRWRDGLAPAGPHEGPCPVCGAPALVSLRYPRALCPVCVLEATDPAGRPLEFGNASLSGGFEARYADDGTRYDSADCLVRGVSCHAEEHRFGGIVVQPVSG